MSEASNSSWHPPISPATTTRSVFGNSMTMGTMTGNGEPMTESPPIPMTAFWAMPAEARASDTW
jgi:hypothetical protein